MARQVKSSVIFVKFSIPETGKQIKKFFTSPKPLTIKAWERIIDKKMDECILKELGTAKKRGQNARKLFT